MKDNKWQLKYVFILEILKQESDMDKPMSTTVLLDKLKARGIALDRRVLYAAINYLNSQGYEIMCERKQQNQYYILDRQFDIPELRILMDAVQAASFISPNKTNELLDKIASLGGQYHKAFLLSNNNYFDTLKHNNNQIYYSVDAIENAFNNNNQIQFRYFDFDYLGNRQYRKEGSYYIVNPLATLYTNDNYYLVCYNAKYNTYTKYRIDRMDSVTVLQQCREPSLLLDNFNMDTYRKKHFGMFTGTEVAVKLQFDKEITDVIFDKFGDSTSITASGDKLTAVVAVAVSEQFFGFLAGLGTKISIVAPASTVAEYKAHLSNIHKQYDN